MPGILPMKVIKIGANAQTRIAQACDRCRSKKIRCDGIRPCCTQCANVGFECKTSDKLSRRAFPRGYTESLEERVRCLEVEVRELKELLDDKDEKIDMLSRIHSQSPKSFLHTSPRRQSHTTTEDNHDDQAIIDDVDESFRVRQAACRSGDGTDTYLAGPSSTISFLQSFKQQASKRGFDLDSCSLVALAPKHTRRPTSSTSGKRRATPLHCDPPSRLVSDQLINVFFQEWAPLFPVLHRPSFLTIYGRYVADPDSVVDHVELAWLSLVFAIAAGSRGTDAAAETDMFDKQWKLEIDICAASRSLETLQALALAQMRCLQCHDLSLLRSYKTLSATISDELGLNSAEEQDASNPLTSEIRKKLFWSLFTFDCFSSVVLGLPQELVKDEEICCNYPVDADDEYISESGIQPSLPGEFTKLSSALALFKAARVLSRVLDRVFPSKPTYELSLKHLSDLSDELELWEASMPAHLRLPFAQDKPSTGTITSRSPILALVYYYIRALIQRPAITTPALGDKASSALLVHASSCKRMVQIIELLKERGLTFSLCLNKIDVLTICGLGSLVYRMNLGPASKVLKDNRNTIFTTYQLLAESGSASAEPLQEVIKSIIPDFETTPQLLPDSKTSTGRSKPNISRSNSDYMTLPEQPIKLTSSTRRQLKAIASRFNAASNGKVPSLGIASVASDSLSLQPSSLKPQDVPSMTPTTQPSSKIVRTSSICTSSSVDQQSPPPSLRATKMTPTCPRQKLTKRQTLPARTNLDYLSFGNESEQVQLESMSAASPVKTDALSSDWERLLGDLDNGNTNIFDASYGGRPIEALAEASSVHQQAGRNPLSDAALAWNAGLLSLHDASTKRSEAAATNGSIKTSTSMWSASSNECLGSAEDPSATSWTSRSSSNSAPDMFSKLDAGDISQSFNFDLDVGLDWQGELVANET